MTGWKLVPTEPEEKEDEIEVTDVMIAAGRTILAGHDPVSGRSERLLLPELFLAMWAARLSGDHIE